MRVVAVVQARMGSTRLPGKVMMPLAQRPMIHHVVVRAQRIPGVDEVVVAIPRGPREQPLAQYLRTVLRVPVVVGDEEDVLARYWEAAARFSADAVVRITGDCPLLSPRVSGQVVQAFLGAPAEVDYASNTLVRTYPRGLDTEIFSVEALEKAHSEARRASDREHVTSYLYGRPQGFRLLAVRGKAALADHRWTVDTQADYELAWRIFEALHHRDPLFELDQVLALLQRYPWWSKLNGGFCPGRP